MTVAIGPSSKAAGFPTMLMALAAVASCSLVAISFLPREQREAPMVMKPAE